ncbi:MAG: hypothetical protein EP330_20335 [Deltaproteobacteria bacterium]|nr:MAG: hypothetical protein EP330_20335 [Deltaproteobacteria bacterium]
MRLACTLASVLCLALVACTDGAEQDEEEEVVCTPDPGPYDTRIHPLIVQRCGECHGSPPEGDAPFSLVEGYVDLVEGEEGFRKVDKALRAIQENRMPEPPAPPLTGPERDLFVAWLTCAPPPEPDSGM